MTPPSQSQSPLMPPLSSLLLLLLLFRFCFAFRCIIIINIVMMPAEVQWNESSVSSLILSPEVRMNRSIISTTEIS